MFGKNKQYEVVYWDIVGRCNAHCKYCFTGNKRHPGGGEIDVTKFSEGLKILISNKLLSPSGCIHLYVWGEPTLHSRFGDIIEILQRDGLHYYLSSNFGHTIDFKSEWFLNLDGIIASMPGFSQESYDRIHKLNFASVINNITQFVDNAKFSGFNTKKITIAHHLYQFNIDEIPKIYRFAKGLNVTYHPYYALLGDLDLTYRFLKGELSQNESKEISSEVFGNSIIKRYENHPRKGCRQFQRLVLDENCNILTCCCLPRNSEFYKIVNVFDPNLMEILNGWEPNDNCKRCINSGLSQYDEKGLGNFDLKNWF